MSSHHTLVVIVEAKAGKEKEFESELRDVVEHCRAEKTCLEYRLHKNKENPAQFILYEIWESQEKHQEQLTKPYIMAFTEKMKTLMEGSFQVFSVEAI